MATQAKRSKGKGNGAAPAPMPKPKSDDSVVVLDDLLGFGRKALQLHGQRIEFKDHREFSILQRHRLTKEALRWGELHTDLFDRPKALENERAVASEYEAICYRLAKLCFVGDYSSFSKVEVADLVELFLAFRVDFQTRRAGVLGSMLSMPVQNVQPDTEEPSDTGSTNH